MEIGDPETVRAEETIAEFEPGAEFDFGAELNLLAIVEESDAEAGRDQPSVVEPEVVAHVHVYETRAGIVYCHTHTGNELPARVGTSAILDTVASGMFAVVIQCDLPDPEIQHWGVVVSFDGFRNGSAG